MQISFDCIFTVPWLGKACLLVVELWMLPWTPTCSDHQLRWFSCRTPTHMDQSQKEWSCIVSFERKQVYSFSYSEPSGLHERRRAHLRAHTMPLDGSPSARPTRLGNHGNVQPLGNKSQGTRQKWLERRVFLLGLALFGQYYSTGSILHGWSSITGYIPTGTST